MTLRSWGLVFIGLLVVLLVVVAVLVELAAGVPGPALGMPPTSSCVQDDGHRSFEAKYTFYGTDADADISYLERATPARVENLSSVIVTVGGEDWSSGRHAPLAFHDEAPVEFVVTGRIIDPKQDAVLRGISVRYFVVATPSRVRTVEQHQGVIPFTATYSASTCATSAEQNRKAAEFTPVVIGILFVLIGAVGTIPARRIRVRIAARRTRRQPDEGRVTAADLPLLLSYAAVVLGLRPVVAAVQWDVTQHLVALLICAVVVASTVLVIRALRSRYAGEEGLDLAGRVASSAITIAVVFAVASIAP